MDIKKLQTDLEAFAEERDWNKYHTPKNLAVALSVEVSELLEVFQWLSDEESRQIETSEKDMVLVTEEIADIQIYLLRLADKLHVDLEVAVEAKMTKNREKYPISLAKGNARKYNRRD